MKEEINIVWLKRDLRLQDHAAIAAALKSAIPFALVYIHEPEFIDYPDSSERHLWFVRGSILDINRKLNSFDGKVNEFYGAAASVFEYIQERFTIRHVFSYCESGVRVTWDRDKQVAEFFQNAGVIWKEFQRDGVERGIKNRTGWDQRWFKMANSPILENDLSQAKLVKLNHNFTLPEKLEKDRMPSFQNPGETEAWRVLESFAENRGFNYHRHISKPTESRESCSRLSPYLAWGNISVKQAYQFVKNHENYSGNKRAFAGFLTRLKWRCHFIQKFEVECDYETTCVNRGYESLVREKDDVKIEAWKKGRTGYPMVDANMRALIETGWINFRMRAMLVSFFCHHLDQDWRYGAHYLARLFLDYEPGIHYTQFQMQAGTTGINTVRIYNPIKQGYDHDPEGVFIKKWVPELANVPVEFIHEPWKMTPMDKVWHGIEGLTYPNPIIDQAEAGRQARKKIWSHRKNALVKEERERILQTHTRNRR